ncbi:hypothetical protein LL967_01140 [Xanthomonas campestris pv. zinniae]|uniref:hypothetical protein n=1 Tax=Xanthomonas cannabis TaxID=1885674 RepID=UPI001E6578AC|nr:hypothetical protein [Xanthomonas campestris pv. zinniae]
MNDTHAQCPGKDGGRWRQPAGFQAAELGRPGCGHQWRSCPHPALRATFSRREKGAAFAFALASALASALAFAFAFAFAFALALPAPLTLQLPLPQQLQLPRQLPIAAIRQ